MSWFHSTTSKSSLMPTSARFCWMNSFIGSGCIWPEPEGEISALSASGLPRPQPPPLPKVFGFPLLSLGFEARLAEPLVAGRHEAFGRDHQAGEQLLHAFAIDREIGGLAHANIVPGRAF